MERQIIETADGSHTLKAENMEEHYHSTNGALQESEHVFMRHGFHKAGKWLNPLNVLEVGFGTGLNALLTYRENLKEKRRINYVAVEPDPLTQKEAKALNYPSMVSFDNSEKIFLSLHKDITAPFFVDENFIMLHLKDTIQNVKLQEDSFNLIYYDAFAPSVQPEMWTADIFKKLYRAMEGQGVLVTYSASGNVKRALAEAGFSLEHPEGPQGKREITVAVKKRTLEDILSGTHEI
ncbi:MAG: tRNA (5-methylaminomethyl-2-thiouridine)(34)-methyltransferase MnmD [Bacteroidota bacterium]